MDHPSQPSWFLRSLLWSLLAIPSWLYLLDGYAYGENGTFAPASGEVRSGNVAAPLGAALTLAVAVFALARGRPTAGKLGKALLGLLLAALLLAAGAVFHILSKPGFANDLR